jgi:hypothetical protein
MSDRKMFEIEVVSVEKNGTYLMNKPELLGCTYIL